MSDSVWPHRWQPTRLLCPRDSPGKNSGVGCHFLLPISPTWPTNIQYSINPASCPPHFFNGGTRCVEGEISLLLKWNLFKFMPVASVTFPKISRIWGLFLSHSLRLYHPEWFHFLTPLLSLCCLFIFIRWPHFLNSQREQKSFWFSVFLTTVPPQRANFLASLSSFSPSFWYQRKIHLFCTKEAPLLKFCIPETTPTSVHSALSLLSLMWVVFSTACSSIPVVLIQE